MYVNRDGVRLYYQIRGKGEPTLLFVHGWLTNADIWRYQVAKFSDQYQTLVIDLRGFGRSDNPEVEYTFDLFADDIYFLLQQLSVDQPVFIGWSKGVSIGLVFAAAFPDRISRLVLVGGGPKFLSSADFNYGLSPDEFWKSIERMKENFEEGVREFIEAEVPEAGTDELKTWLLSLAKQTTPQIALNSIINDTRYDLRPSLPGIKLPSLICYGELDVICPPGASKVMHAGLPNSEIHAFPGLGHIPFLTDPESFNALLKNFLSNQAHRL